MADSAFGPRFCLRESATGALDLINCGSLRVTKEPHKSDSKVQRETELELIAQFGEHLGVPLESKSLRVGDCQVQLDGYFEDENRVIAVEAFSRIGTLASGQRRKIMSDILKLAFFGTVVEKAVEKYLVFSDGSSAGFLQGKAWAAQALKAFNIKIHVVRLSDEAVERLNAAQRLQKEGMASPTEIQ